MNNISVETKNVLNDLKNEFLEILNVESLTDLIFDEINKAYNEGLEKAEKEFNINFEKNVTRLNTLQSYTVGNVKDLNEELSNKLKKVVTRAIIDNKGVNSIISDVQKVFGEGIERVRSIARTEMVRAQNVGHLDAARQSGLKLYKKWDAHLDKRTSPVCRALDGKEIPLDEKFVYKGEEFDAPPAHVNCFLEDTKITTNKGKKLIQDIKIGDIVLTHKNRYKKVKSTMINESDCYYEVKVGSGNCLRKLKVTGNHPVLTQRGWIKIKDLTLDDYLVKIQ